MALLADGQERAILELFSETLFRDHAIRLLVIHSRRKFLLCCFSYFFFLLFLSPSHSRNSDCRLFWVMLWLGTFELHCVEMWLEIDFGRPCNLKWLDIWAGFGYVCLVSKLLFLEITAEILLFYCNYNVPPSIFICCLVPRRQRLLRLECASSWKNEANVFVNLKKLGGPIESYWIDGNTSNKCSV